MDFIVGLIIGSGIGIFFMAMANVSDKYDEIMIEEDLIND